MEDDVIWIPECGYHGDRRHATVHEAGHVLAAVQLSVPYLFVVLHDTPQPLPSDPSKLTGGWVQTDRERMPDVLPRPGFEFALAGRSAEKAALHHYLEKGWIEDVNEWRRWSGMGAPGHTQDEFAQLLGDTVPTIITQMENWAIDNLEEIEALAAHLDRTGTLTAAEVGDLLA